MRLLLMRHGQTHANISGDLDTAHPGVDLTDLGRAQAVAASKVNRGRRRFTAHLPSCRSSRMNRCRCRR